MDKKTGTILILIILLLVTLGLNGLLFYNLKHPDAPDVIRIHDSITIVNTDTIYKEKIIETKYFDSIIVTNIDTFNIVDTIRIPIEVKEATFTTNKDSIDISARIVYEGYKAQIDTIQFMYNLHYSVPLKKQRKIHISALAGFGAQYGLINKKFDVGPYIGIGCSYDIW